MIKVNLVLLTHTHTQTHAHTHTHEHINTHTHKYKHTYMHIHAHNTMPPIALATITSAIPSLLPDSFTDLNSFLIKGTLNVNENGEMEFLFTGSK